MSDSQELCTGDPEKVPASYSRFLLPFSYRKTEPQPAKDDGEPRFVPIKPLAPAHRRQYLTFETASVLYERALWLELREKDEQGHEKPLGSRFTFYRPLGKGAEKAIKVELAAPRLVLFEWPAARENGEQEEDPFATGFLCLELWFPPTTALTLDDLCAVNELFRYWMKPFPEHSDEERWYWHALRNLPLSPDRWQRRDDPTEWVQAEYLGRWAFLLQVPCVTSEGKYQLVRPEDDQEAAKGWVNAGQGEGGWVVYSDCRAFVWTCAVMPGGAAKLVGTRAWTQLLNVDPPGWGELSQFEREWTKERTYQRWVESGSLYGFTVHSGAAALPWMEEPPVWRHFRQEYFDQTLLLLYTRVGLFRFSRWLSEVSAEGRKKGAGERDERLERSLSRIRKSLTLFANLYQFPLLSNQQQGIEMYTLAREVMDIQELANELQTQSQGSHELLDMLADQEESLAARRLNVVAAGGLALAVATGFLGMNIVAERLVKGTWSFQGFREWAVFIATAVGATLLLLVAARNWKGIERLLFRDSDKETR